MDTLVYLQTKFNLDLHQRGPIDIPNIGRDPGLARLFYLLEFTIGAEIGVERGLFSEALCRENPLLVRLYLVDAWKPYDGYRDHVRADKLDGFYRDTEDRMARYKAATILRMWSVEAAQQIPDASLDFVYLDANHSFQCLTADLAAWTPKVRPGGLICGHDFRRHKWPNQMHVEQVIYGWTDAYDIHPWFVLGRKEKVEGELRDDGRSWLWVHQPRPVWRKGTDRSRHDHEAC